MKSMVGRAEHARKAPKEPRKQVGRPQDARKALKEPRKQEIKTVSYVHVGDKLVNTEDLSDEQRVQLGTWLKSTYLNGLFQGQAVFHPLGRPQDARKAP